MTDKREVIERHFNEHLNGAEAGYQYDRGDNFIGVTEEEDEPAPTVREVKDAISMLMNNKASGKDGIGADLIKMGPDRLIWDTEQKPEE